MTAAFMLTCVAAVAPASADGSASDGTDTKQARRHFETGRALYDLWNYEDALHEFLIVYDLSHKPLFIYNVAHCYRKLGRLAEARLAYQRFLAEVPETDRRAEAEKFLAEVEELLARAHAEAGSLVAPRVSAESTPTPEPLSATRTPAPPTKSPIYKRWWLWTSVVVALGGAAVGLGLGLGLHHFDTTLPTVGGGKPSPMSMALPLLRVAY
jgi:tetratricopeptide (TPR) repeat protein